MKASVIISLCALTAAFPKAHQLEGYDFDSYLAHSGKSYTPEERPRRAALFNSRLARIREHNSQGHSWKMGVNHFTDLTDEERKRHFGYDFKLSAYRRHLDLGNHDRVAAKALLTTPGLDPNANFSWIAQGKMGGVKNQGSCGSCWAFASTSVLESHVALANNNYGIPTLAPQQFTDCVQNPNQCGGKGGCDGGTPELAYEYTTTQALIGEYQYPYLDINGNNTSGARCPRSNAHNDAVLTGGYVQVPANNRDALLTALQYGPVVLAVYAEHWSDYESGIYNGCRTSANNDIDHAVVLTGIGSNSDGMWWEIRNSWGPEWGEYGTIRLWRSPRNEACYIDTTPLDGTICKFPGPVPSNITVCGECGMLWDPVYPTGVRFANSN